MQRRRRRRQRDGRRLSVKASDLYGLWFADTDEPSAVVTVEERRIFGFSSPEDAPWAFPLEEPAVTKPISAFWLKLRGFDFFPDIKQIASYEVANGKMVQTVIGDVSSLPGTMFETDIISFTPKQQMTIESPSAGTRTYTYADRCPAVNPSGSITQNTYGCSVYIAVLPTIAVDKHGGVHVNIDGGAHSAVVLRWGSYLAVLLDRDIEASAALADWIEISRAPDATIGSCAAPLRAPATIIRPLNGSSTPGSSLSATTNLDRSGVPGSRAVRGGYARSASRELVKLTGCLRRRLT